MKDNKYIKGFEGLYTIYKDGRIYSHKASCFMTPQMGNNGYWYVKLRDKGKRFHCNIHRALVVAFIPNPENKPQVNHKDSDRSNYKLNNLEWATISENQKHSYRTTNRKPNKTGTGKFGKLHSRSVKINQYTMDGDFVNMFYGYGEAARQTPAISQNIFKVCHDERKSAGGYKWEIVHELQEAE